LQPLLGTPHAPNQHTMSLPVMVHTQHKWYKLGLHKHASQGRNTYHNTPGGKQQTNKHTQWHGTRSIAPYRCSQQPRLHYMILTAHKGYTYPTHTHIREQQRQQCEGRAPKPLLVTHNQTRNRTHTPDQNQPAIHCLKVVKAKQKETQGCHSFKTWPKSVPCASCPVHVPACPCRVRPSKNTCPCTWCAPRPQRDNAMQPPSHVQHGTPDSLP
jgi:hypothetical protein